MNDKKRIIGVFTGNRAEYGLQMPILRAIAAHPLLEYRLFAAGAHLDPRFGRTLFEIEADGFRVHKEITIHMEKDSLFSTAQAIGSGVLSVSQALDEFKPDIFVVYADRFEGFAALIASTQMGIPTAHIEGGDITEGGALDDSVRHAMTKLAHLHFTTNADAAWRIEAMGEEPWRVHDVGFPAIDLIAAGEYASREEVCRLYDLDLSKPIVLFTQHSVTTQFDAASEQIAPSLAALSSLALHGVQIIVTYPNNDAGGQRIIETIQRWKSSAPSGVQVHKNLGRANYHGVLHLCGKLARGVCVGNSSSGIKETPAFGCPAVDIGSRQLGRLAAKNVIRVDYDESEIRKAIEKSLFDDGFRSQCATCENPYGIGNSGARIADVLANIPLDRTLVTKKMTLRQSS